MCWLHLFMTTGKTPSYFAARTTERSEQGSADQTRKLNLEAGPYKGVKQGLPIQKRAATGETKEKG